MSTQDLGQYIEAVRQNGIRLNPNEPIVAQSAANFLEPIVAIGGSVAAYSVIGQTNQTQSSGWFTLNPAAAQTITLPTPVPGLTYTFVVQTSATGSNTLKWIVATGASGPQYIQGTDFISTVGGATSNFQGNGTTHVSVNMNGSTTGGLIGTTVTFTALSTTIWQAFIQNFGSGSLATSFGTS